MKSPGLVARVQRLLQELRHSFSRVHTHLQPAVRTSVTGPRTYERLERVLLTDGVGHTLFEEFAEHRREARGDEETGWVLLGWREAREAIVLATLPAGAGREASVAHVRFNSEAQGLASRIVRQKDRRLSMLGVVHTHPGSLRHPSDGDLRGDREWVAQLRGQDGVFGIGNADAVSSGPSVFAFQPRPNVHCLGGLRFSWYGLHAADGRYRDLPADWTIGPDLARPLHPIWSIVEKHAGRLDRLVQQLPGIRFTAVDDEWGPGLALQLPLAERDATIRVIIRNKETRYYVLMNGQVLELQEQEENIDRGVYLLLAELADAFDQNHLP